MSATERRLSDIAGYGLFAVRAIPAGTVVLTSGAQVNHSCEPNLGWADGATLVSMRDIAAGEELVTDYAMGTTDPDFILRCHCPSARCRQMVEGTDWRIPQLQRRYAGWWSPSVLARIEGKRQA